MPIDPRWISTPVGAAIGVALTRKVLDKKDLTVRNQAIGGALGGGAGYVAGEYMRPDPKTISREPGVSANKTLEDHWLSTGATGTASDSEVELTDSINPQYGSIRPKGEGNPIWNDYYRKQRLSMGSMQDQFNALGQRVGFFKSKAEAAGSAEERDHYLGLADENRSQQKIHGQKLFVKKVLHGTTYLPGRTASLLYNLATGTMSNM